jgi:NitT/TauT family transport system substrate-binding protein
MIGWLASVVALVLGLSAASAQDLRPVRIGTTATLGAGATFIALEKGYFREAGIDAQIELTDTSGDILTMLATNQLQMAEGGLALSYFNALKKGFPITIVLDRVSTPIHHRFLIRPELKGVVKQIGDLRGRVVAINAPSSINVYETGKVLAHAGLTLDDVQIKYLAFGEQAVALRNGVIDATILIPPLADILAEKGIAARWLDIDEQIDPRPFHIAVNFINTDWAKQNPKLAQGAVKAIVRGVREYCQAYHGGSNREEVVKILLKHSMVSERALLEKYPWSARTPDGSINSASVIDIQDWFRKRGVITTQYAAENLVDLSFARKAVEELGPFALENQQSQLPGCR